MASRCGFCNDGISIGLTRLDAFTLAFLFSVYSEQNDFAGDNSAGEQRCYCKMVRGQKGQSACDCERGPANRVRSDPGFCSILNEWLRLAYSRGRAGVPHLGPYYFANGIVVGLSQ